MALGRASVTAGKHGEAIGLLRRAIKLGADSAEALPVLAQALAAREQRLAAMVCVTRAKRAGANESTIEAIHEELRHHFGASWAALEDWIGAVSHED